MDWDTAPREELLQVIAAQQATIPGGAHRGPGAGDCRPHGAKHSIGTLPSSLEEALNEFERDDVITRAVGSHIAEWFMEAKRQEWNDYRVRVTPWEIDRYLETY